MSDIVKLIDGGVIIIYEIKGNLLQATRYFYRLKESHLLFGSFSTTDAAITHAASYYGKRVLNPVSPPPPTTPVPPGNVISVDFRTRKRIK